MQRVVLDASAIMAFLYNEPGAESVEALLLDERCKVFVSAVNLCEAATLLTAHGMPPQDIRSNLKLFEKFSEDFTVVMAIRAAAMSAFTRAAGLSLGDRACLALAAETGATAWTTDRAWKNIKTEVTVKLIRHE